MTSPYDDITWTRRDVVIKNYKTGATVFEQYGVEFPDFWSDQAVQIVTSKYFRGKMGTSQREWSLKHLLDRVVDRYSVEGVLHGYFDAEGAKQFSYDMKYYLAHQYFSFNSPVWFNVGAGKEEIVSACYLLDVDDSINSILDWYKQEGQIFKGGSGAGVNLSNLRGSDEYLSTGGKASGPVSFMRGADAIAGTIKSGGKARRAAKLVCLDVDHPDIEEFIGIKAKEEHKIRALSESGFDMGMDSVDSFSVQYQNANNSVRVSDEFMRAVVNNNTWDLINRGDKQVAKTVNARDIMQQIAQAAWECADPGIMYHDTINQWHTTPSHGPIRTSNPCIRRGAKLLTSEGYIPIEELAGKNCNIYDGSGYTSGKVWHSGVKKIVRVTIDDGRVLDVTPDHLILTDEGWVEAQHCEGKAVPKDTTERLNYDFHTHFNEIEYINVRSIEYLGIEDDVYDFSVPTTNYGWLNGIVAHNCCEIHSNSNSSCNLASVNLVKFYDNGTFDVDKFVDVVGLVTTAMDISISFADYPVESIGANSREFRQIGVGFTNLGSMLMRLGVAYDSDYGRDFASAVTALMNSAVSIQSAYLAKELGPYTHFEVNKDRHLSVLKRHSDEAEQLFASVDNALDKRIALAAIANYETALNIGMLRNAQTSTSAPTGTVSFMMDADTTGIEPAFGLVTYKTVSDGSVMTLPCASVKPGLEALGYDRTTIIGILQHIADNGTIVDAPGFITEHLPVFATANGDNVISVNGHLDMMAAVQPHISGAISKTINMPQSATVGDIFDVYMRGWELGLKAVSVYRDGSKNGQVLSTKKDVAKAPEKVSDGRKRLPRTRTSTTTSFTVGGSDGYLTSSAFDDGSLGEIFVKMAKQGSTLGGIMDAFAIAVSIGLQHGVPFETFYEKFVGSSFEPAGLTDDHDIRFTSSVIDYIFKRLNADLNSEDTAEVVVDSTDVIDTGELCLSCGGKIQRAGTCGVCQVCGTTTGCS